MRTVFRSAVKLYVCTLLLCFLKVSPAIGAETLKVTKDQLEFREEPRVAEETLLGTLRIGTSVEWTGTISGDWFEVQAPNGQVGWVHKSGLSTPQTLPKPQEKPVPKSEPAKPPEPPTTKPEPGTSRTISSPTPGDELSKKVSQLEKTNTQSKALLEAKDKRINELDGELKKLEQKLVDTAQSAGDTKQLQTRLAEIQKQVEDALKQKDETVVALSKEKEATTNLQKHIETLQKQASEARPRERVALYALNIVWIMLLSFIGFLYVRLKRREKSGLESEFGGEPKNYIVSEQYVPSGLKPRIDTLPSTPEDTGREQAVSREFIGEPAIVMAAGPEPEIVPVEEIEEIEEIPDEEVLDEEVIIELADVLPTEGAIHEIRQDQKSAEDVREIEIVTDEEGPESEIEELEAVEEIGTVEELEEIEEVTDVEEIEEVEQTQPERLTAEVEETAVDDFDYAAIYTESTRDSLPEDTGVREKDVKEESTAVEIGGEKFERLAEQDTQIIELEEGGEEQFEGELVDESVVAEPGEIEEIEELGAIEELEEVNLAGAEIEELGEVEIPGEVIALEEVRENQDDQDVEVLEVIEEIEEIEEVDAGAEQFEALLEQRPQRFEPAEQPLVPLLLEPSPVLIEPEHEPAEPLLEGPQLQKDWKPVPPSTSNEPKYDIELVQVGENRKQILRLLSKIEGLTKPPQELVDTVPSIIARGATQSDAKNFQMVMQKLGSEVRLIKK